MRLRGFSPNPATPSGYRLYTADSLIVLSFLRQARALGFTLGEIKRIIVIRCSYSARGSTASRRRAGAEGESNGTV